MNLDEKIRTALSGIVDTIVPHVYTGGSTEYIVFNYSEYPLEFAADAPRTIGHAIQVHLYMPMSANPNATKALIKTALFTAGFEYPSIQDVSDLDGQHYVFETEYVEVI